MWRLLKLLVILLALGGVALVGYAYLADLSPDQKRVSEPVMLDVN